MHYLFGQSIAYTFTVIDGAGEVVSLNANVSARIYDTQPTLAQCENTATGHLEEKTSAWTSNADGSKTITFSAITDADPDDSEEYEPYWVVVNFKYELAGPTVWVKELIHLYRPNAWTSRISTVYTDLYALEPKLEDVGVTSTTGGTFITEAKKAILRRLKGLGSPARNLFNLDELNDATRYLATARACLSKYCREAPEWKDKFDLYMSQYDAIFAASSPGFNPSPQEDPDPDVGAKSNTGYFNR